MQTHRELTEYLNPVIVGEVSMPGRNRHSDEL